MTDAAGRRRGVKIHRLTEAVNLVDTDFASAGFSPPEDARSAELWGRILGGDNGDSGGGNNGGIVGMLLTHQSARDGGFSLAHVWSKPNCPTPLHSNDADCLLYVISGVVLIDGERLFSGDSFYAPADTPYQYTAGPEGAEILEIRHGVERVSTECPTPDLVELERLESTVDANSASWKGAALCSTYASNPKFVETSPP